MPFGDVISMPFATAAVCASRVCVWMSFATTTVAVSLASTHSPVAWTALWTAEATAWMKDWLADNAEATEDAMISTKPVLEASAADVDATVGLDEARPSMRADRDPTALWRAAESVNTVTDVLEAADASDEMLEDAVTIWICCCWMASASTGTKFM